MATVAGAMTLTRVALGAPEPIVIRIGTVVNGDHPENIAARNLGALSEEMLHNACTDATGSTGNEDNTTGEAWTSGNAEFTNQPISNQTNAFSFDCEKRSTPYTHSPELTRRIVDNAAAMPNSPSSTAL